MKEFKPFISWTYTPGRYETKVEDKFKADIGRCYRSME